MERSEVEGRIAVLEKSGGLTEQQKAFLELLPEERQDFLKITQWLLEYCYGIFVKRHPQLKSLRYSIWEHRDAEKPIVSKLDIDGWKEKLSAAQKEEFEQISENVTKAIIDGKAKT